MSIKVSNLISCDLCIHLKESNCNCGVEQVENFYRANGKKSALSCPEFRNERVPLSGEIKLDDALKFMLAGCSEFVMLSIQTNKRLYYKLEKKLSTKYTEETPYVYWLNVGETNGTYTYAGVLFYDDNIQQFKFGRGARGNLTQNDLRVKSLLFVLNKLVKNETNLKLKVFHVGKCGKCGKRLTDISSILTGLGPVCAKQCGVPIIKYRHK